MRKNGVEDVRLDRTVAGLEGDKGSDACRGLDAVARDAGRGSRWAELLDEPEADPAGDRAALWAELLK